MTQPEASENSDAFGATYVVDPEGKHQNTIILLHGRGSTGEEFAEELFESTLSNGNTLQQAFPGYRWVFPSSKELWSTTFQEFMPAWFEAHSLTDTTAREDLQIPGIKESVAHIRQTLDHEAQKLDGTYERIILGGISQGGAIALWALLSVQASGPSKLGAFVGFSTWLPFAKDISRILSPQPDSNGGNGEHDAFVKDIVHSAGELQSPTSGGQAKTPVFLGHGTDDAYVDITLGQEVKKVLSGIGSPLEWKEYSGAEQEGHWLKIPEEVDDIAEFLSRVFSST